MKLENERADVTIITDGASSGNPGPSGYAAIIQINRHNCLPEERIISGAFSHSTNNISELTAVLEAVRSLTKATITDLRSSFRDIKISSFITVAKLTAPAGFATIVGVLSSPILAAILGAVGLTISGVECYLETHGKLREAKLLSPYHYLISTEQDLKLKKKQKK